MENRLKALTPPIARLSGVGLGRADTQVVATMIVAMIPGNNCILNYGLGV